MTPVAIDEVVARRLPELRAIRRWSQRQLAEQLSAQGGRPTYTTKIARIEQGERRVPIGEALAICAVLGVRPSALLTSDDPAELLEVIPGHAHPSSHVRRWLEGTVPLGMAPQNCEAGDEVSAGEVSAWVDAVPADVKAANVIPAVVRVRGLASALEAAAGRQDADGVDRLLEALADEVERARRNIERGTEHYSEPVGLLYDYSEGTD
jgi:transcriptional regulator with XRE-family HTH domain